MSRWARIVAGILFALAVVGSVAAVRAFHYPTIDEPGTADAVVLLAGGGPRIDKLNELMNASVAPRALVASAYVDDPGVWSARVCNDRALEFDQSIDVLCFEPEPSTTRGEAGFVSKLATDNGWDELVVIASTDQITRARLLFDRCFAGTVRFVAVDHSQFWPLRVLYESGAWIKAQRNSQC